MKTIDDINVTTTQFPSFRPVPLKVQDVYGENGNLVDRQTPEIDFGAPVPAEIADIPPVVNLSDPVALAHAVQENDKYQPETPIDLDAMQAVDMAKKIKSNLT